MLEFILADQLADLPSPIVASNGQEWQYVISTVRLHIGRSTGRSTPSRKWHLVVKNDNMTFLLLELICADQLADLSPSRGIYCKTSWDVYYGMYLAAIVDSSKKGGNFSFISE